jgi:uncharacterized ferritin-like protein (DUF455 family)
LRNGEIRDAQEMVFRWAYTLSGDRNLHKPFDVAARMEAGFDEEEMDVLTRLASTA